MMTLSHRIKKRPLKYSHFFCRFWRIYEFFSNFQKYKSRIISVQYFWEYFDDPKDWSGSQNRKKHVFSACDTTKIISVITHFSDWNKCQRKNTSISWYWLYGLSKSSQMSTDIFKQHLGNICWLKREKIRISNFDFEQPIQAHFTHWSQDNSCEFRKAIAQHFLLLARAIARALLERAQD